MKVALLGCGWIAGWGHARALPQVSSWEVVAVADPSQVRASAVAEQLSVDRRRCMSTLDELLELDDVELVAVLTPPHLHRQQVEAIVAAGKHVACEKPFALTLADADAMLEAADAAGVSVSVFHNHVCYEEHQIGRRLVDEGAIGDVEGIVVNGLGARPWAGAEEYRPEWRRDPGLGGGGALMDAGIHGLYLTEHYFGTSPSWVGATMVPTVGSDHVETYAYVQLGYAGGVATVGIGWGGGPAHLEVFGRKGRISMAFDSTVGYFGQQPESVRLVTGGKLAAEHPVADRDFQLFTPAIYEGIAERVRDPSTWWRLSGEQGREALELVLAAYASAARREVVPLPLRRGDPVYAAGLAGIDGTPKDG